MREHVTSEVCAGRFVGPIPPQLVPAVHVSPMGLVPKSHSMDKWRVIVDLSAPVGHSVNDGLAGDLCSLSYSSVDQVVDLIVSLGQGVRKLDIKQAYRLVPVHPQDCYLLAVSWEGEVFVDRTLPFDLSSAPKLFSAIADSLAWALHCKGVRFQLYYLDDFLLLGKDGIYPCDVALASALEVFGHLGVPVAPNKVEGPAPVLTFLGIVIDAHHFQLRLPLDKLARLQEMLGTWRDKKIM